MQKHYVLLITMVVYAVAADASIIRIFLAGFLPGFFVDGFV
jgi:TRAP-type C4-dicarboxylate transport system permease large subunit